MDIRETKQVIVMRTDLNMRKGKMCAQTAHASLNSVLNLMHYSKRQMGRVLCRREDDPICDWLDSGLMTKVVVGVDSLEELEKIEKEALNFGVYATKIVDAGKTEFDGKETVTCLAIGPDLPENVDKITGHLKLL